MQDVQELADIVEEQLGGWLVQDVQGPAGAPFAEFPRELHPLRLPARERGSRLAQFEVAQADLGQETNLSYNSFWMPRGGLTMSSVGRAAVAQVECLRRQT